MRNKLLLLGVLFSSWAMAWTTGNSRLLELPANASIRFNVPFVVTSTVSRSGTPVQSLIKTIDIDLKGDTVEALWSRHRNQSVINKLKQLKHFASLERVFCYLDFNSQYDSDIEIAKGATFRFAPPVAFGTPSAKFTKTGRSIRLENYADKHVSGSFAHPLLRRLYCSFKAAESERYNETFLDDLKISHLEALLAPHFELRY